MANHIFPAFYGIADLDAFYGSMQAMCDQIVCGEGNFIGDNMIVINRNLSFLDDAKLMAAFKTHAETDNERATLWRLYTNCHFAKRALALDGDYVECACYRGMTAHIIADYIDLGATDKGMWLYDLFEHDSSMRHHDLPDHGSELHGEVEARFADFENVRVIRGEVPAVLAEHAPERVAHAHLDLNDATAELGALEILFDRLVTGGTIVFDDYGWLYYRAQKEAEDAWLESRGYNILELPTGQGLLIK